MKSSLSTVIAASALALLSACGGGGGDSAPAPSQKVAITSANQNNVVRAGVNGALAVSLTQGNFGSTPAAAAAARTRALDIVLQRALASVQAQRKGIASASVRPAATSGDVTNCGISGTLASTFDDKDGNGVISKGDVLTATFAQCKESASLAINGVLSITVTSNPTDTQLAASANFQNIVVTFEQLASTISGTLAIGVVDNATTSTSTLSAGAGGLNVSLVSSTWNESVSYASGFVIATSEVTATQVDSLSLSGTLTAQSLGGTLSIATTLPLTQGPSDEYPSAGQVVISGASGSAVRVTAISDTQVSVELDANGDGTYESSQTVAWGTLVP